MRCRPILQEQSLNKSRWSAKGYSTEAILSNSHVRDWRCQLAYTESSTCITCPTNHNRIPYWHRTHLNVLRQGPRHLPDNWAISETPSTSTLWTTKCHRLYHANYKPAPTQQRPQILAPPSFFSEHARTIFASRISNNTQYYHHRRFRHLS